jgi:hypothetical protein
MRIGDVLVWLAHRELGRSDGRLDGWTGRSSALWGSCQRVSLLRPVTATKLPDRCHMQRRRWSYQFFLCPHTRLFCLVRLHALRNR